MTTSPVALRAEFVDEGQFVALPLAMTDEALPMDADASSITALAVSGCGRRVYGATRGTSCHLFVAYFKAASGGILDLGTVEGATDIPALVPVRRIERTSPAALAGANRAGGFDIVRAPMPDHRDTIQEPSFTHPGRATVARVDGMRLDDMAGTDAGEVVVCLAAGRLVRVDLRDGSRRDLASPGGTGHSGAPTVASAGEGAWWAAPARRVVRVDLSGEGRVEETPLALPAGDALVGLVSDGAGGTIVADAEGTVWRARAGDRAFAPVARVPVAPVRCMACLGDGRLYALCGEGIGHFVRIDLATRACVPLGAVATAFGTKRYAFDFSCAAVSREGYVYFGERDRGAHLWVYFPPALDMASTRAH